MAPEGIKQSDLTSLFSGFSNPDIVTPAIAHRLHFGKYVISLEIEGESKETLTLQNESITLSKEAAKSPDVRLIAERSSWENLLAGTPPIGFHSIGAMIETDNLNIETHDAVEYSRRSLIVEQLFASLRPPRRSLSENYSTPTIEPVQGRYVRMEIGGRAHRVYFEEAGSGTPLLCLHTAGADGRQYREILNDEEITSNHRVIAFDLPWHGKSSPPTGYEDELYMLTTDHYLEIIRSFVAALGLDKPIVMGCSIGGRAVLHLALRYPKEFRAMIGLQSATYSESKMTEKLGLFDKHLLLRPDVHPEMSLAGLQQAMSPTSPRDSFRETLWHYAQGGPGIFMGDLFYYVVDGDMRNGVAGQIDTAEIPVHLLTGDYDLSATPEMTFALAKEINASSVQIMNGLGHFPMSEDPEVFKSYLKPLLARIAEESNS